MTSFLTDSALLQHLEEIAAVLRIDIRYENLESEEFSIASGGCKVLGRNIIIVDSRRPLRERMGILARELAGFDLENIYILPQVREFILLQASPREKSLPHK